MTVSELLGRMSSRELSEWMAHEEFDPIGTERIEWMFAMLMCMTANMNRARGQKSFKVSDFMPDYGGLRESKSIPSGQEMLRQFREAAIAARG